MKSIQYIWAKLLKKIRGSAIINSKVAKTAKIYSGSHVVNSEIERYTYCGYDCEIINAKIGSFCSIAGGVRIGGAMHPSDWVSTSPLFYEGRSAGLSKKFSLHAIEKDGTTIIGDDVWIGNNALIKQGVSIGNGAIIGMGSVVTKNIPPYAIVGGVPAKIIRYRFDKQTINKILESKWWDMSEEDIIKFAQFFNNPNNFIEKIMR